MNAKRYKVGYTTGVFDMFHIGHLNIIRRAKEQCERLIVGVSTDELVRKYKHKTPIVPYEERQKIVAALRYVDEVVPQETMDKMCAWEALHFEAIFHGDDWKGSTLYNEMETRLKEKGVDIVYFPHTDGTSSTLLNEKLQKIE